MAELDDPHRLSAIDPALHDVTPDEGLDALVREAAGRLGTPIAAISVVGGATQVFRAQTGLPAELSLSRGTSRSSSFCQLVVKGEQRLVVGDAEADPRVPRELVERYGVRAYAGTPLTHRGAIVGTLCVIDVKPRQFDEAALSALEPLAREVSARLAQLSSEAERSTCAPRPARPASLDEVRALAGAIGRALEEVDHLARQARSLSASEVTAEALERLRGPSADALSFVAELGAMVGELSSLAESMPRGSTRARLLSDVAALRRTLGEMAVAVRTLDGFVGGSLTSSQAAQALSVAREVLPATSVLLAVCRSLCQAIESALPAARAAS